MLKLLNLCLHSVSLGSQALVVEEGVNQLFPYGPDQVGVLVEVVGDFFPSLTVIVLLGRELVKATHRMVSYLVRAPVCLFGFMFHI
jgi:hypothetical protein